MGYTVEMILDIGKLKLKSDEILDIGAQDLTVVSDNDLQALNQFIARKRPQNTLSITNYPVILEAKEVFERSGYKYTNIDVDERPHTIRMDLATFKIPRPRKRYPLVVNVGTTEHLSSPIATFALMHELCATDGFIYNDVPLFGLGNHGLINPTPKFWHALIWMNQYRSVTTKIRSVNESALDRGNFYHDYLNYIEGLSQATNLSYIIRAVFQKTTTSIFVPPFDAVIPDSPDGLALAKLIAGSYLPFVKTGAYTEKEAIEGINDFLTLNQRHYRATNYYQLLNSKNIKCIPPRPPIVRMVFKKIQSSLMNLIKV